MTAAALKPSIEYIENGGTLAFAAPFRFRSPQHLLVKRISTAGVVTTLVYGADYNVTGGTTDAGGTVMVTVAAVAGTRLNIRRVTPRAQDTQYTTGDTFPAESHEGALDRAMLIDQEQDVQIDDTAARALLAPEGEKSGLLPSLLGGINKFLSRTVDGSWFWSSGTGADAGLRTDIATSIGSSLMGWIRIGIGTVIRSVSLKLAERVSFEDFGAIGDYAGVPGSGTDDTLAIQKAINYCIQQGAILRVLNKRYRVTAPLVIDRSFNSDDPINGAKYGISLRGGGSASSQIVADHSGICIDYRGGPAAGWHSFFYIDGVGIVRSSQNFTGTGLKIDQAAYVQIQRFDVYGFNLGLHCVDVLTSQFMDSSLRGNNHAGQFQKGTRTCPNNIAMRGITVLNNQITGLTLIEPSVFSFVEGSIESNGYTGILADPNSWGIKVVSAGTEGSVGLVMKGVYSENNNGIADIWILQTSGVCIHSLTAVSFLRLSNTRYVTSNILFSSPNETRLSISGCGFKSYGPYVDSNARPFIGGSDSKVIDAGGNIFFDSTGGTVGLIPSVFAPINIYHSIPFAALPDVGKNINGIQYCTDGGGSPTRPALAVSDGIRWWQIVLGQFAGNISSAGAALALPRGWSCVRNSTGVYTITHNLGAVANAYAVTAMVRAAPGTGACSGCSLSANTFEIYFANFAGIAIDVDFSFNLSFI